MNIAEKELQFENVVIAINRLSQNRQLTFITQEDITLADISFSLPLKPIVSMADKIVELNLRMIESYLPEILFAFCLYADAKRSVNDLISVLIEQGFPYSGITYPKVFLEHKIITFIEAMLFADIFNRVWDGKYQSNKLYVNKVGEALHYYLPHEIRALLKSFLDSICIQSTKTTTDGSLFSSFSLNL